jgi:hypothetical protein
MGITLILDIAEAEKNKQRVRDTTAVYFVSPSLENIQLLSRDIQMHLYDSVDIHFSSSISRNLLEKFAEFVGPHVTMAEHWNKKKNMTAVNCVVDEFANFICADEDFADFAIPNSFVSFSSVKGAMLENCLDLGEVIEMTANSMLSVLMASKCIPVICYQKSREGKAELVAQRILEKLTAFLRGLGSGEARPFFTNSQQQAKVLIVLDRDVDFAVCLQHCWTYKSIVNDLFSVDLNKIRVPVEEKGVSSEQCPESPKSPKECIAIDFDDPFWSKFGGDTVPNFFAGAREALEKYKAKKDAFNEKTGLEIDNPSAIQNIQAATRANRLILNNGGVDKIFRLADVRENAEKHIKLSSAISREIIKRKLDRFYAIEDSIIAGRNLTEEDVAVFKALFNNLEHGNVEDRIRFFLISFLAFHRREAELKASGKSFLPKLPFDQADLLEIEEKIQMLRVPKDTSFGKDMKELSYLKHVHLKNASHGSQIPQTVPDAPPGVFSSFVEIGAKFVAGVKSTVEKMGQTNTFVPLPVTRLAHAVMNNPADAKNFLLKKTGASRENFCFINPTQILIRQKAPAPPKEFSTAFVLMLGGGNFAEYQNLMDFTREEEMKEKSVVYCVTEVMNSLEFLKQLRLSAAP